MYLGFPAAALLAAPIVALASAALADSGTATPLPAELAQPARPAPEMLAQTTETAPPTPAPAYENSIVGYFDNWFVRSDAAKASQPHWMTPLVTVTPRLEQEVR